MEYLSKNNISCKAVLYKDAKHVDEFIQQLFDEIDMHLIIEKIDRNPFSYNVVIRTVNKNKDISEQIYLKDNSYFVKTNNPNIGINGCLVMPKDIFEFIFKERE